MKNSNFKLAILACMVIFGTISCNSPKQKADKLENAEEKVVIAQEALDKAVLDSTNEYARYKIESEAKLKENDLKIAELKATLKADKMEIRTKYENELYALEAKNAKLKSNIGNYQENDKNKWEKFKASFNNEMDELGKAISKFAENNR